jgi:hypothetical protein
LGQSDSQSLQAVHPSGYSRAELPWRPEKQGSLTVVCKLQLSVRSLKQEPCVTKGQKNMEAKITNQDKKMSARNKADVPNEVIEEQTKKIPNLTFLGLGLLSMGASLFLQFNKRRELGNFVGQWVPTLLIFGLYNKLVKVEDELLRSKMH